MSTMHSRCNMLERNALLIVIVFIASTCSIWQENVRPKLYVELGKFLFFYPFVRCIGARLPCRIQEQNTKMRIERKKKTLQNEIICIGKFEFRSISFDWKITQLRSAFSFFFLSIERERIDGNS